jgi:hypothetical protein
MWQRRSPPQLEGRVLSRSTHGSTGALPSGEAGSSVAGHVLALEPSSVKRRGPESRDAWQLVVACPVFCLDLKPVCGGTRSIGYQH